MIKLSLDYNTGLLHPIRYCASSHYNERPSDAVINMIVVHGISLPPAQFGTDDVEEFFCGRLDPSRHETFPSIAHLQVSAHLFIRRSGEIIQFVPFAKRAWHAGVSQFQGQTGCNDFSIGIELEGCDEISYAAVQYLYLAQVIQILLAAYPQITPERIVGHSDIAPGRKTDPGPAFDWNYLRELIKA